MLNFCANFKQQSIGDTAALRITKRYTTSFKKGALCVIQTLVLLTNFLRYRTVVLLTPLFKTCVYPLCVSGQAKDDN